MPRLTNARIMTGAASLLGFCLLQACSSSDAPSANGASGGASNGGATQSSSGSGGSAGQPPPGLPSGGFASGGTGSGVSGSAATAGAAGASTGSAGQSSTACEMKPTLTSRKAPAFPPTQIPSPKGILFRLMNNCSMTLWLQNTNNATQWPENGGIVELASKATKEYDMPNGVSQRIQTFKNAPPGMAGNVLIQFAEMNAAPGKALNYNLSHVDWVGLPVEINGIGASQDCGVTACYQSYASLLTGCPPQLLDTVNGKCIAPFHYCSDAAHAMEPFCTVLNAPAATTVMSDPDCAGGTVGSPADIFGCAGFWGSSAACCAKVHRGVTGNAKSDTNNCLYYKNPPYDVYAAWAHQQCPFIYAFAYDDFNDQSGFHTCTHGTEMDITYCPGDP
jgi:hypothetical protein